MVALVVVEVVVDSIVVVGEVGCVVDAVTAGVVDVVGTKAGVVTTTIQLDVHRKTDRQALCTDTHNCVKCKNMKLVQFFTGFIFCTFPASVKAQ